MIFTKITGGCVIQKFNDIGDFLSQEFKITDHGDVTYECEGDVINVADMPLAGREYQPFNMCNKAST